MIELNSNNILIALTVFGWGCYACWQLGYLRGYSAGGKFALDEMRRDFPMMIDKALSEALANAIKEIHD